MKISEELTMSFPDSFRVMGEEEYDRLRFIAEGAGICLSDQEKHSVASIGWKQIGAFAGFLLNLKDLSGNMERSIREAMAAFQFSQTGAPERKIGGIPARGIRFRYRAEDGTEMAGESLVLKRGKAVYYFHFYTREALEEENLAVWEGALDTAKWA